MMWAGDTTNIILKYKAYSKMVHVLYRKKGKQKIINQINGEMNDLKHEYAMRMSIPPPK